MLHSMMSWRLCSRNVAQKWHLFCSKGKVFLRDSKGIISVRPFVSLELNANQTFKKSVSEIIYETYIPSLLVSQRIQNQSREDCPHLATKNNKSFRRIPLRIMNINNLMFCWWPLPNINYYLHTASRVNGESYLGNYTGGDKNAPRSDRKTPKRMAVSFHMSSPCKCQATSEAYQLWKRRARGGAEVVHCAWQRGEEGCC